jgi:hypothetical protein
VYFFRASRARAPRARLGKSVVRVVDSTVKNLQNNVFKPSTRTEVQGIPVLGYFFWSTVLVSTCALVTFPCDLCRKTQQHPQPAGIMKN